LSLIQQNVGTFVADIDEILNEGYGISIDDAVSEMQATFVARVVEPMSAVLSPFQSAT
jgi:hypothetical protein